MIPVDKKGSVEITYLLPLKVVLLYFEQIKAFPHSSIFTSCFVDKTFCVQSRVAPWSNCNM